MREIDGRLSQRAAHYWPGAIVVKEVLRGGVELPDDEFNRETWWLERRDADRANLGNRFTAAVHTLGALIRAEKLERARGGR